MTIIGITGPTGAGKTTALNELVKLGGCIYDADAVYHGLLRDNMDLRRELEDRFGPLTDEKGDFQRKKLGAIVFADPAALADLNAIAHRYVVQAIVGELEAARQKGYTCAAIDAIALFESGLADLCHTTVSITAPPDIRVRRIMAREGISEEYARSRVAAQHSDEFFTSRCAHNLVNDHAAAEAFAAEARTLFEHILEQNKN